MLDSPFGFERPEDSPGFLLWQTTVTWQRLIKKVLDAQDVSHAQFVIMALLLWFEEKEYEPHQNLIAEKSKLDKMTVSKSLKKLSTQGFVIRVEHERDTRAKSISLTQKGKSLIKKLVPLVEKIDDNFFNTIAQKDQKEFIRILTDLNSRRVE